MVITLIILAIILVACAALISDERHVFATIMIFFSLFCLKSAIDMCTKEDLEQYQEPQPTAMDVYQGKTVLQVTYVDGEPIDSIMVFRKQNTINNE